MNYISLTEFCTKYGLDKTNTWRKIQAGRIPGAKKIGNQWAVPEDAVPPTDGRVTNGNYKGWRKKKAGE